MKFSSFLLSALPLAATAFAPKHPNLVSPPRTMQSKLDAAPKPIYEIDFSDPDSANIPEPFVLENGAAILDGAPGPVSKALRIASDGPYATLPGIDLSPSEVQDSTLVISLYLESIPADSKGWVLNTENGRFDRAIILHDDRFGGIGFGTGTKEGGKVYNEKTVPKTGEWFQLIATFRQKGDCNIFYDGVKAPITQKGKNNSGENAVTIGRVKGIGKHWADCWVKDVAVFEHALSDEEATEFYKQFKADITPPPQAAPAAPMKPAQTDNSNTAAQFIGSALFTLIMSFLSHA